MDFPIKIRVKVNKPETKIVGNENGVYLMDVCAKPQNNKANLEIVKYFKKLTGKNVKIKGMRSKVKIIELI